MKLEPSSKRLITQISRRAVVIILTMITAFGGFNVHLTAAYAPDEEMLIAIQKIAERVFVQNTRDLLADQRAEYVRAYFDQWDLPAADYAEDFVKYADQYNLDWRLVAAVGMRETTGCKHPIENHAITKRKLNCFGWGNASFSSIEEGIKVVSRNLAGENPNTAYFYADKDLKGKLYAYNSVIPDYYDDIVRIMDDIYSGPMFAVNNTQ
jgi:hypothetical protein